MLQHSQPTRTELRKSIGGTRHIRHVHVWDLHECFRCSLVCLVSFEAISFQRMQKPRGEADAVPCPNTRNEQRTGGDTNGASSLEFSENSERNSCLFVSLLFDFAIG